MNEVDPVFNYSSIPTKQRLKINHNTYFFESIMGSCTISDCFDNKFIHETLVDIFTLQIQGLIHSRLHASLKLSSSKVCASPKLLQHPASISFKFYQWQLVNLSFFEGMCVFKEWLMYLDPQNKMILLYPENIIGIKHML